MSFPIRNWDKMEQAQKIEIRSHAKNLLNNLDNL
jgi:deoxyribodipyrimidine photolyase-related protein